MSVDTYQAQDGTIVVRLRGGCTDRINLSFKNRQDALALLKALRNRVR